MEKRKCLTFLFCLILCYSLFQHTAIAQSSSGASIFSQGSITYPPSNVNWAVIPDDWGLYENQPQPYTSITHIDYNVEHTSGNPSIRCDGPATNTNEWREADCNNNPIHYGSILVNPGDHVFFSVWIKTNPSTIGETGGIGTMIGAIFGIDLDGSQTRLWEVAPGTPDGTIATDFTGRPNYSDYNFVPYGSSTWTYGYIDFIVPSKTFTTNSEGVSVPAQTVVAMCPWVCADPAYPSNEAGSVWFADATLYINP